MVLLVLNRRRAAATMSIVKWMFVCLCVNVVVPSSAEFDPLLNVESCTKSKLVVSTYNAAQGGLIYIQGQGEDCKMPTVDGVGVYEFDFDQCGIQWEMLFKIVIQKNQGYQTGADKQVPIFCVADREDLVVSNTNEAVDKGDDGGYNLTVKPSAFMTFYKVVAEEEVMGREVKLSDTLIMALQLDSQWSEDFDIKAKYCVASDIVIIDNYCATDMDLFPNFSRIKTGYLISQFGAFRATSLEGGSVVMNFTCILEVCKDACDESDCGGAPGWGRRKREITLADSKHSDDVIADDEQSRSKRESDGNFDIGVGGNVNIVEKYSNIQIITSETMCLNAAMFIVLIVFLSAGVIGLGVTATVFYRKWSSAQASTRKTRLQEPSYSHDPSRMVHEPVQKFANPFDTFNASFRA